MKKERCHRDLHPKAVAGLGRRHRQAAAAPSFILLTIYELLVFNCLSCFPIFFCFTVMAIYEC